WLLAYPDQDPGHEDEWKGRKDLPEEKPFVGFLIHLTPLPAKLPAAPELQDGFYSCGQMDGRKPAKCPAGLEADDVKGMPSANPVAERPVQGVDVHKLIQHVQLKKLPEPITVSLKDLLNAFTVAWYA